MTRRSIRSLVVGMSIVLALLGVSMTVGPVRAAGESLTLSDYAPGAQPSLTFTYTATKARIATDQLLYSRAPSEYSPLTSKTCSELTAMTTVKVNGVLKSPEIIDSNPMFCMVWSGGIQLRFATGYSLSIGDTVEVTIGSGIVTNPSIPTSIIWTWDMGDYSNGDLDPFVYIFTVGVETTSESPTSTVEPMPSGGGSTGSYGINAAEVALVILAFVGLGAVVAVSGRVLRPRNETR